MTDEELQVSLARAEPFVLGSMRITPSAREVEWGAERRSLEPRVMQVLVALAQHLGSVVSRDALVQRCWEGRAISEDALNRAIAKLRRVTAEATDDGVAIETVSKVGYRLRLRAGSIDSTEISSLEEGSVAPEPLPLEPSHAPIVIAASDLETRGLSLLFQGTAEQTADGVDYLRQAVAVSPSRASLWGSLAMGYVLMLPFSNEATSMQMEARAAEAASQALALDPHEGRATAAQISLQPTFGNWQKKEALLRDALASATPGTPPLMFQQVQFLASIGRTGEALDWVERLSAISPLLPWIQSARANLLASAGRLNEAQIVAESAAQMWPRDQLCWFTRFNLALFGGRPQDALAIGEARSRWPVGADTFVKVGIAAAEVLISKSQSKGDKLLREISSRANQDRASAETAVQIAAVLGETGLAFRLAAEMYQEERPLDGRGHVMPRIGKDGGQERNTALLFLPPLVTLHGDPRFMELLHSVGIEKYFDRLASSAMQ